MGERVHLYPEFLIKWLRAKQNKEKNSLNSQALCVRVEQGKRDFGPKLQEPANHPKPVCS